MSADLEKLYGSMEDGIADTGNQALKDCLTKSKGIAGDTNGKNKSGQQNQKVVKTNNLKNKITKKDNMK
jgi:hypothetical protein